MVDLFWLAGRGINFQTIANGILIERGTQRFNECYQAELAVDSFAFDGFSGLSFSNITLKPAKGDSLMKIGYLHTKINMRKLLRFKLALGNLEMKDAWFNFVRHDSISQLFVSARRMAKRTQIHRLNLFSQSIMPTVPIVCSTSCSTKSLRLLP